MKKSVYIVAVENSADHLGAELTQHIRAKTPDVTLIGIGGAAMATERIESEIDISGLAILGFVEGLKSYPMILDRVRATVESIMTYNPDAAVLIDSWGFMIRVAKGLKKAGYQDFNNVIKRDKMNTQNFIISFLCFWPGFLWSWEYPATYSFTMVKNTADLYEMSYEYAPEFVAGK